MNMLLVAVSGCQKDKERNKTTIRIELEEFSLEFLRINAFLRLAGLSSTGDSS
jgi:hypothetical protein